MNTTYNPVLGQVNETSLDSVYNSMILSSDKLSIISNEMVVQSSNRSIESLNCLGSSLSAEYDRLSQTSIAVAGQNGVDSELSIALRKSVLQLGKECLNLIKQVGSVNSSSITESKSTLERLNQNISKEINQILNVLSLLVRKKSSKHEAYQHAITTTRQVLKSFELLQREPDPSKYTSPIEEVVDCLDIIIRQTYDIYHMLKSVIVNVSSSSDEAVFSTLMYFLTSLIYMVDAVKQYVVIANNKSFQLEIVTTTESTLLFIIDFFMLCDEIESDVQQLQFLHNKEIFKASTKDVVNNVRDLMNVTTKQRNKIGV